MFLEFNEYGSLFLGKVAFDNNLKFQLKKKLNRLQKNDIYIDK